MNPDIKQQWLAALRSGRYAQTTGALRRVRRDAKPDGFCCLGVLCDLAQQDDPAFYGWQQPDRWGDGLVRFTEEGEISESRVTPYSVCSWAGMEDHREVELPFCDRNAVPVFLTTANDNGCTFDQIADLIAHFL